MAPIPADGRELEVQAEFAPAAGAKFGLRLHLKGGEALIGYSVATEGLFFTRGPERLAAPLPLGPLRLHLLLDRAVITALLEPGPVAEGVALYADGGARLLGLGACLPPACCKQGRQAWQLGRTS